MIKIGTALFEATEEAEEAQAEEAKDDIPVIVVDVEQPQEEFLVDEESKNDISSFLHVIMKLSTNGGNNKCILLKLPTL